MEQNPEKHEINSENPDRNPDGTFKKGSRIGELGGRPKGSEDFKTKWLRFVDKVAKSNNMTPEEIDEQLLAVGFKKAKEGDYNFYRDIHDRVYGKAPATVDITTKGESINTEISKAQAIAQKYEEELKREL